jgi:hypothetical protein
VRDKSPGALPLRSSEPASTGLKGEAGIGQATQLIRELQIAYPSGSLRIADSAPGSQVTGQLIVGHFAQKVADIRRTTPISSS